MLKATFSHGTFEITPSQHMWLRTHRLLARPLAATVIGYIISEKYEAVGQEHRSFVSSCQADDYTRNSTKHSSTRVSKPLSRNFIADAADVASPAVVNIGGVCLFLISRFLSTTRPFHSKSSSV